MRRRFMTCRYSYNLDNYVNFTMLEDGIVLFRSKVFTDLQVSINGDAWESDLEPVSVKKGDILALKSYGYSGTESTVGHIGLPACNLGGNIMSLIYGDEAKDHSHELSVGQFQYLFNHTSIVNVEVDFLPATTLADSCYAHMFDGCTMLVNVPELPATTLADSCYAHMFDGCTMLVNVPELPATTLADSCYAHMFDGCTMLVNVPELPATTLADYCYYYMFYGCRSLTVAPELPATTLADRCYYNMFGGCTSLTTAPELPATTLANNCYSYMFSNCSKLNYIKMLATDISATNSLYGWVSGVASTGTFVKSKDATWDVRGEDGIPNGWTVETE